MKKQQLLGDAPLSKRSFPGLSKALASLRTVEFTALPDRKKSDQISATLLDLIRREREPCFLLSHCLEFIEKIDAEGIFEQYRFSSFELWLNQHSGLSPEENYRVRAKIAGKFVERSDYQAFFPIGMGKVYEGTHFVTAHKSPDLDTTIASFWGWLDAFAARVCDGLHVWNVPGGPPSSQIEIEWVFHNLFGPAVFSHLPQQRTALNLTAVDLVSQKGMVKLRPEDPLNAIVHDRERSAAVIVDGDGFYLGDWRNIDVDHVRQVILLLSSCLRWFENHLHVRLIGLFAREKLGLKDIEPMLKELFGMTVSDCEPANEFSSSQKKQVDAFLKKVLHASKGLASNFEEFGVCLAHVGGVPFEGTSQIIAAMKRAQLFDAKGALLEERPRIFAYLEKTVGALHEAILKIRSRLERLDIALKTKSEVFGEKLTYVTLRDDVEEVRAKMSAVPYLTVNDPAQGKLYPIGVIQATDIRKAVLGTVSLRDFCNREEMTIPSYLEVISVIDHHKSSLNTLAPPFAIIADAQSSNSLVALQSFIINDRYSLAGQTAEGIQKQLQEEMGRATPASARLAQRLLQRLNIARAATPFYIHPEREWIECLHFLYAILDDTDLLSKVTALDVDCVASLLNRMKTILAQRESEVISLDDLARDASFPKKAAQRILQNEEMYSLYKKVYQHREKEIEKNLYLAAHDKPSNIFADTKEQNGCCRVGQTKLFANNWPHYAEHAGQVRKAWLAKAIEVRDKKPDVDLHIHMMSTIVSAEEVYKGAGSHYAHKDEIWIWVPSDDVAAVSHLKRFLNAFQASPGLKNNPLEVEFLGENGEELAAIFKESFLPIPMKMSQQQLPIAILRFKAGSLNSRKAMVSPFLPSLVT